MVFCSCVHAVLFKACEPLSQSCKECPLSLSTATAQDRWQHVDRCQQTGVIHTNWCKTILPCYKYIRLFRGMTVLWIWVKASSYCPNQTLCFYWFLLSYLEFLHCIPQNLLIRHGSKIFAYCHASVSSSVLLCEGKIKYLLQKAAINGPHVQHHWLYSLSNFIVKNKDHHIFSKACCHRRRVIVISQI